MKIGKGASFSFSIYRTVIKNIQVCLRQICTGKYLFHLVAISFTRFFTRNFLVAVDQVDIALGVRSIPECAK